MCSCPDSLVCDVCESQELVSEYQGWKVCNRCLEEVNRGQAS